MTADLDKFQKPNFDGRLAYIDVLKNYLNSIAVAQVTREYTILLTALRSFFIYTSPFNQKLKKSKEQLKEIRQLYRVVKVSNNEATIEIFEDKLDDFQLNLMNNIKYILMPLRGDEKNDWADFASQSDIQTDEGEKGE